MYREKKILSNSTAICFIVCPKAEPDQYFWK